MRENGKSIIRVSDIGEYVWCIYAYHLLKAGVTTQQTLQDLQKSRIIPEKIAIELQQKHHIEPNTPVDKIIGKGIIPPTVEKKIIEQNIMLQGTAKHEDIGKQIQSSSRVAEHRRGYTLALIIILIMIVFFVIMLLQGGIP